MANGSCMMIFPGEGSRAGKESVLLSEKARTPCIWLEGVVKLWWLWNLLRAGWTEGIRKRDTWGGQAGGRSGSGRVRSSNVGTQKRGMRGHPPLCSAAAVDSERMALPTNTPWRQLKASYTRGTPRTQGNRVTGGFFLWTLTPSLLLIWTPGLALLGSLPSHF